MSSASNKSSPVLTLPDTLPVFVTGDFVLFPGTVAALELEGEGVEFARALAREQKDLLAVVAKLDDHDEEKEEDDAPAVAAPKADAAAAPKADAVAAPKADAAAGTPPVSEPAGAAARIVLESIGTAAKIVRLSPNDAGGITLVLQGLARIRVGEVVQQEPVLAAKVEILPAPTDQESAQVAALHLELKKLSREILALLPGVPREVGEMLQQMRDPGALADLLAFRIPASQEEKQRVLEAIPLEERLQLVVSLAGRRQQVLQINRKIDGAVRDEVGKAEREHILRRKLKAVQSELDELNGQEPDDGKNGADALEKKLAEAKLPPELDAQVKKELRRLSSLPQASPEVSVSRTWLSWIADLPWSVQSQDNLDVDNAQRTLDADHQGLKKVKKRIASYLAVRSLKGDMKGPILCLVGPPGVGKTSLGQSIARAMGRKFVRVSLGGVRDEAEIRGHRRTYIGALPGRLVQALKRAGTNNPVVMLDEIDKLGQGYQGDPAAGLLEVLDPEQNNTFTDHYLEVPFDLSKVLFIATANSLDSVAPPLRDRMEIIEIPSYTVAEKMQIARSHLVPKQLEAHGLSGLALTFDDAGLSRVITAHTREAGVRGLERRIAEICRGIAVEKVKGDLPAEAERVITKDEVEKLLGPDKVVSELLDRTSVPGVATGLAWTPVGGEVLFIETLQMPGKGQVMLTGQLGSVMKESVQAALSYLKANAALFGLPADPLEGQDLHVHFPDGGTPKDGPSAGVTIFTALVSLLTGIRVRHDVAMTGEATLRGRVLPVGGIKEKVLAAHRLGIKRIILPERCMRDLADVPEETRAELEFIPVKEMTEVLAAALEQNPMQQRVSLHAIAQPTPLGPAAASA